MSETFSGRAFTKLNDNLLIVNYYSTVKFHEHFYSLLANGKIVAFLPHYA